jgi:sphingomyelin phosphodiesterase acid-like 3
VLFTSTKSSKSTGSKTPKATGAKSTKACNADAKAEKISPANTTSTTGSFIWFTDVHYDQYYGTSQAAFRGGSYPSCPGYEENHCNNTNSPKYSIYGCGASSDLVESFLSEAARATNGKPDFVLFTGDATRHFADGLKEGTVHNAVTYLYNTTKAHFPDTPVLQLPTIVLGNNDWYPHDTVNITSYEACVEGTNGEPPVATNEHLQNAAKDNEEIFADKMEEAIFACGGYTRREVVKDLVVLSLNTMIWGTKLNTKYNKMNPNNKLHVPDHYTEDPFGQLEWLKQELLQARVTGKKAYVIGHHPPADQSIIVDTGNNLWSQGYQLRYENIVSEFSDVVAGQMFGHVHTNELRRTPYMPKGVAPLLLQGAVAPGYCMDPNFSIVEYDDKTKAIVDMSKYFADLKKAFETKSTELVWNDAVKSVVDLIGMNSFTNEEVLKFAKRALDDKDLWNKYWNEFTKGRPQETDCTGDCIHQELCVIACGTRREIWYSCVIGYGDCTVGDESDLSSLTNLGEINE